MNVTFNKRIKNAPQKNKKEILLIPQNELIYLLLSFSFHAA